MYVIYADVVFLENLIVDYILLIATAKLTGVRARRWRAAAGAALGGIYAVLAALPEEGFLRGWALKLAVGVFMALLVFGGSQRFFRVCLVFFGVSAAFAGAVMASAMIRGEGLRGAYLGQVSFASLLLSFAGFYFLFSVAFRSLTRRRVAGTLTRLTVFHNGKKAVIPALLDTGNGLSEPISGLPVTVCSLEAVIDLFDEPVKTILRTEHDPASAFKKLTDAGVYSFLLVPYRAVGVEDGLLLAFRPQSLRRGQRELTGFLAIDPGGVGAGTGYSAIVGV